MPSEEYRQRKIEYIKRYQRKNYRTISLKLRKEEDRAILEFLASKPSKSEYIKSLVAADMAK